jgi:O-antigen/teichoic acid export membrane protein
MFNICHVLHIGGALVLFLLLESVGLWYIHTHLNVPPGKESDAMFVFQVSTIVACLSIANVPFQSLFTVHERFATVAVVDVLNALVKLVLVIGLLYWKGNGLRLYAVLMSLTALIFIIVYRWLCHARWPQMISWKPVREWKAYKEVLVFNNYNLLSSASMIARSQGSNVLINAFFGTTVNAAFYYAGTVQNYVNKFIANFDTAAAPQITQNIGAGNAERSVSLAERVCRICILLFLLLFFPLWSELDFILNAWLGSKIPEGTVLMCRWTLLVAAVSATSAGLGQLINAYGRVKWYKIEFSVLYLGCLVAGLLFFRAGFPAYTIIICFVVADLLSRVIQLILLHYQFGFNIGKFLKEAYLRPAVSAAILMGYLAFYRLLPLEGVWAKLGGLVLTSCVTAAILCFVGLKASERKIAASFLVLKTDNPRLPRIFSDRAILKARYYKIFNRSLDLKHPRTFNEKIQWMKLHDRDPRYTVMSDKYRVKEIVSETIGKEHVIPTLGVWDSFDKIDFDSLPDQFVLKCTHDSGGLVICRDRKDLDIAAVREKIERSLRNNFYYHSREWQYKDIPPRIIAEPYMQDGDNRELRDYKFYCFDGEPAFLYVSEGLENHSTARISFLNLDWTRAPFRRADYSDFETLPEKPGHFDEMIALVRQLAKDFRFVRVDMYEVNGTVYFGEMTFTPTSGLVPFIPDGADLEIGRLLRIK